MTSDRTSWAEAVHAILRDHRVQQVPYLPDAGLAALIRLVSTDPAMRAVPLTTEEEGVAMAVGAWLGGQRSALLLQSSGAGNCINTLGMVSECRVPLLMLVTMRGQWGEFNPWQMPMAQATGAVLAAMGVIVQAVERDEDVAPVVAAAARLSNNTYRPVAVLISQRVAGTKEFGK
ncbi:MAG: phosphonopyruvate decarboxylase [Burkholderiales bacterium]|nr:phosphonopyruvate decarboxylase [Burkholderiales bacterium]